MPKAMAMRRLRLAPAMQAASPRGGPLEVDQVRGWELLEPVTGRRYTLVRVTTRDGFSGWGECGAIPEHDLVENRSRILGTPATAYEVVRRRLEGQAGLRAAVDMALLDIVGRYTKAPVYQALGGPTRNKARALAQIEGATDDQLRASMERARSAGYRAFLVPVPEASAANQGRAFVEKVRRRLESLRAAGGEGFDFALDAGGALTTGDAASVSTAVERLHPLWIDEPCRVSNLGAVRKLAAENVTPIGFGRHLSRAGDFQDLLREEAVDVLRPAVAVHGITGIRRIAALAETYYVAVAPYHDGGPVATAAALHLAASLPNFFAQQIPLPAAEPARRMRIELAGGWSELVVDGFAQLPTGPGLGIAVDQKAVERYGRSLA